MSDNFIVLLYHGVTSGSIGGIENHSRKHVLVADFEAQMSRLRDDWNVVSYRDLLALKRTGSVPPRTVCVTFDDGFENNYTHALPILELYEIPATFFLATGFIGSGRVFWVDKIEYLINEWAAAAVSVQSLGETFDLASDELRIQAVISIKSRLKNDRSLIAPVIAELEDGFGSPVGYEYPNYRTMSWDMVRAMARSPWCEIGAHTVDHEILTHLDRRQKKVQIEGAKETLMRELEIDVDLFSYPEGQVGHFDAETIELLKEAGFTSSPTAMFGRNDVYVSDFEVRRNMVEFFAPFDVCLDPRAGIVPS